MYRLEIILFYIHNVTIYHNSKVGNNCIIHSGVVVGSDGFGFAPDQIVITKKLIKWKCRN